MKISFKLTLTMLLLSLVTVAFVGITLLFQAKDNIAVLSHEKAVAAAHEYAWEVKDFFTTYWRITEILTDVMGQYENILPNNRRNFINKTLRTLVEQNENVIGVFNTMNLSRIT